MLLKQDEGRTLKVICQKTVKAGKTKASEKAHRAYIEIEIGAELRKVLHRCKVVAMRHGSPYVLNHPSRSTSKQNTHRTQVLPRFLSRAFKDAVNDCGLYDDLQLNERPTLHEVRSLGGRIYRAMGKSEEFIQNLYGHTKIDMTEHYLEGDKIVWSQASADMDLAMAASVIVQE